MSGTTKKYQYLFVYGTLKRDLRKHVLPEVDENLEFVGETTINGKLFDLGEYPGAVPDERSKIKGEVFRLLRPRKVISVLDAYEGYDAADKKRSEYLRKKERVTLGGKTDLDVWIYWYNQEPPSSGRIRHQNYVTYLRKAKKKLSETKH